MPILEIIGWSGSALLVISLLQTRVMRLRVLNSAASAVLVDRDTRPAMGNVHNLGLIGEIELVRGEAPDWITGAADGEFDLVFLDPPYREAGTVAERLDPQLGRVLSPEGRVIGESDNRGPLEFPSLETVRERRYGRTVVTFHRVPSPPDQKTPPE